MSCFIGTCRACLRDFKLRDMRGPLCKTCDRKYEPEFDDYDIDIEIVVDLDPGEVSDRRYNGDEIDAVED